MSVRVPVSCWLHVAAVFNSQAREHGVLQADKPCPLPASPARTGRTGAAARITVRGTSAGRTGEGCGQIVGTGGWGGDGGWGVRGINMAYDPRGFWGGLGARAWHMKAAM